MRLKKLSMIFKWLLLAAGTFGLISCAQDNGVQLEEDQLSRMVVREKSFEWIGYGFSGDLTLSKDGSAILIVHGVGEDVGRWEQNGSALCVQFKRAIQGAKRCADIARLPDGTYEARKQDSTVRLGIFSGKGDE